MLVVFCSMNILSVFVLCSNVEKFPRSWESSHGREKILAVFLWSRMKKVLHCQCKQMKLDRAWHFCDVFTGIFTILSWLWIFFSHSYLSAKQKWIYAFWSEFYACSNAAICFRISSIVRREKARTCTPFFGYFWIIEVIVISKLSISYIRLPYWLTTDQ